MSEPCCLQRGEGYGACVDEGAAILPVLAGTAGILDALDELGRELGQRTDGVEGLQRGHALGPHHQRVIPDGQAQRAVCGEVGQLQRLGRDVEMVLVFHDDFPPVF